MKNIFQLLEAWVINWRQSEFERAALKLTAHYVVSTFFILLLSSGTILFVYSPLVQDGQEYYDKKVNIEQSEFSWHEAQENLLAVMVLVDLSILIAVGLLAFVAARRTLRPIKQNQERQLQFLATVAHELRTPLAVIQAGGDTMSRQDRSIDEYKEYVADIGIESKRLTRLTDQLLQLLRGTEKIRELVHCDFGELVTNEVDSMLVYASSKHIQLNKDIQSGLFIEAVPDEMIQILQNLIKNAVDYNKTDGEVMVTLNNEASQVVLKITDTGIGIPLEKQGLIFKRFETLDRARTHTTNSGAGLGLSIVKEIIEKHKGQITVSSQVGVGSTFTVTIPQSHS